MKKIALITALVIGTGSVALATEFDPNPANRYPASTGSATRTLQSAPVRLQQAPEAGMTSRGFEPFEIVVPLAIQIRAVSTSTNSVEEGTQ